MTTTKEKIKVMQAYEDGRAIEVSSGCGWHEKQNPSWNWEYCDYRIKPEKVEPEYRPYENTDEMIADWKERFKKNWSETSMPLIWVIWDDTKSFIDGFSKNEVSIRGYYKTMDGLLKAGCTYLDGSPCGKEVTE